LQQNEKTAKESEQKKEKEVESTQQSSNYDSSDDRDIDNDYWFSSRSVDYIIIEGLSDGLENLQNKLQEFPNISNLITKISSNVDPTELIKEVEDNLLPCYNHLNQLQNDLIKIDRSFMITEYEVEPSSSYNNLRTLNLQLKESENLRKITAQEDEQFNVDDLKNKLSKLQSELLLIEGKKKQIEELIQEQLNFRRKEKLLALSTEQTEKIKQLEESLQQKEEELDQINQKIPLLPQTIFDAHLFIVQRAINIWNRQIFLATIEARKKEARSFYSAPNHTHYLQSMAFKY